MIKKIIDYGEYKEVITSEYQRSPEWYKKTTSHRVQIMQQRKLLRDEFPKEELDYLEEKRKKASASRTRKTVRELILSNVYDGHAYFVTLTYGDNKAWTDQKMLKDWYNFARRYKRNFDKDMKYILFPEKHKKGDWHLHVILFDAPQGLDTTLNKRFIELWGHGVINKTKPINNKSYNDTGRMANYLVGYLTGLDKKGQKQYGTTKNKKAYFPSRNLKRPSVITDSLEVKNTIEELKSDSWFKVGDRTKHTRFSGMRTREQYITK